MYYLRYDGTWARLASQKIRSKHYSEMLYDTIYIYITCKTYMHYDRIIVFNS